MNNNLRVATWGRQRTKSAFTLIELLIVVAIIAILAAIAVPNFIDAQTRGKVSRTLNDLRVMRTALESYTVDNNEAPRNTWGCTYDDHYGTPPHEIYGTLVPHPSTLADGTTPSPKGLAGCVTTPIAYVTTMPVDPFVPPNYQGPWTEQGADLYRYWNVTTLIDLVGVPYCPVGPDSPGYVWALPGTGNVNFWRRYMGAYALLSVGPKGAGGAAEDLDVNNSTNLFVQYDPTNGTVSGGSIFVTQKSFEPPYVPHLAVIWWDPL